MDPKTSLPVLTPPVPGQPADFNQQFPTTEDLADSVGSAPEAPKEEAMDVDEDVANVLDNPPAPQSGGEEQKASSEGKVDSEKPVGSGKWEWLYSCDGCGKPMSGRFWSCPDCEKEGKSVDLCGECEGAGKAAARHPDTHLLKQRFPEEDRLPAEQREAYLAMKEEVDQMSAAELRAAGEAVEGEIALLQAEIQTARTAAAPAGQTRAVQEGAEYHVETFEIPPHSIPIRADVRHINWKQLGQACQFDAIMMDPPWQLASAQPTRGVALGYSQLHNNDILSMGIPSLQREGFLLVWVINARYQFTLDMMAGWGYRMVEDVTWVKATVNRRVAKGHGFYLQHAKETCVVGVKGNPQFRPSVMSDVIIAERRGQSQKPEEIYHMIEALVPNGRYLEIFARRNNLRNHWVSIGNEI